MSNEEIVERIQKGIDVAASQERLLKQNRKFVRHQVRRLCGHMENKSDFEDYEIAYSIYSRDLKKALDSALRILDADTRKAT